MNYVDVGRYKKNNTSKAVEMFRIDYKLYKLAKRFNPDVLIGGVGNVYVAHVSALINKPSIIFSEDDTSANPANYITYPFATNIIVPLPCDVNKWQKKKITYKGYHELAYLHPKYFTPDKGVLKIFNSTGERYFILRLVELSASHDIGKTGITKEIAGNIIPILKKYGKIFITSERELEPEFEKYRLHINPESIFHALFFADMYIGDSQTMAAEAAVLGTPSIRFNDFVGKLGYLEELEQKYHLTYGIRTSEPQKLYDKVEELLNTPNLKEEWQKRRDKLLKDKIDVTAFMVWLIENYPESVRELKNPKVQERFK
jgi:predicted glycosyltransferase